jgi:hypothetical protein
MHVATVGRDIGLQLFEQVRQAAQHVLLHLAHLAAQLRRIDWRHRRRTLPGHAPGRTLQRHLEMFVAQRLFDTRLVGKGEIDGGSCHR